ncbi:MAG: electron transfer flavoprotein subunit beta/FixA family protein [Thermodesulfobacteriota bacterium]
MPKPISICVCVKSVVLAAPENIRGGIVPRDLQNSVVNPFDKPALRMGLDLVRECGGSLTALSMGPEPARQTLLYALALGADRAALLSDPALAGSDTLATSAALAAAVKALGPFDLVLFGTRSADSDTGQVAAQTAELLDVPFVSFVLEAGTSEGKLVVRRTLDGYSETYRLGLPAALSVHPRALPAGDPTLSSIETTYASASVESLTAADLGLSRERMGETGSPTRVLSMTRTSPERKCEFLAGTAEKQAQELISRLVSRGLLE